MSCVIWLLSKHISLSLTLSLLYDNFFVLFIYYFYIFNLPREPFCSTLLYCFGILYLFSEYKYKYKPELGIIYLMCCPQAVVVIVFWLKDNCVYIINSWMTKHKIKGFRMSIPVSIIIIRLEKRYLLIILNVNKFPYTRISSSHLSTSQLIYPQVHSPSS